MGDEALAALLRLCRDIARPDSKAESPQRSRHDLRSALPER